MPFVEELEKLVATVSGYLTGPIVPAAIEIGKDVLNLIDKAKDVVDSSDVATLEQLRTDLEPKVMAHADSTEKTLRGEE